MGLEFEKTLKTDKQALEGFITALINGVSAEEALETHMVGVSAEAINCANELKKLDTNYLLSNDIIGEFETKQKKAAIGLAATDKSLKNCSSIINEFNLGCKNTGISQDQFITSIQQSNPILAKYLTGIEANEASMGGYIKTLISTKAATIGATIATSALNAAITMGVSVAITALITGISKLIHYEDDLIEKSKEAASAIKQINDDFQNAKETVDNAIGKFAELSKGVDLLTGKNLTLSNDDYNEFLNISNELAETFPTLTRHYDENGNAIVQLNGDAETITNTLKDLLETERALSNQEIIENLPDLYKGIKAQSDRYEEEINDYTNIVEGYQEFIEQSNKLMFDSDGVNSFLSYTAATTDEYFSAYENVIDVLKELGYAYQELTPDYDEEGNPIGFNIEIDEESIDADILQKKIEEKVGKALTAAEKDLANSINKNKQNWSGLLSAISAYLQTDESYKTLSDGAQSAIQTIINGIDYSELDFKNWDRLKEYIDEDIVALFADDNGGAITKFIDIQTKFNNNECTVEQYQQALDNVNKVLSGFDDKKKKQFEIALGIEDFQNSFDAIKKNLNLDKNNDLNNWINGLTDSELQIVAKLSTDIDAATWDLDKWKQEVESQITIDIAVNFDIPKAQEEATKIAEAVSESLSSAGLSDTSKQSIISIFGGLDGFNKDKVFERTANGIKLNYGELNKLQKQQENINKQGFDDALTELKSKYSDLTEEAEKYEAMIEATDQTDTESLKILYKKQDGIIDEINNTSDLIDKTADLKAQYDGLTSSYAKWQQAKSQTDNREGYSNIGEGYKGVKELIDQGWYSDSEVTEYLNLMLNINQRTNDNIKDFDKLTEKISGTNFSIVDFFQYDDGQLVSDGLYDFLDVVHQKLGDEFVSIDKQGNYTFDTTNNKIKEVSETIGMSTEAIDLMIQAMQDAGMNVNWVDDLTEKNKTFYTEAEKANRALKDAGITDYEFNFRADKDKINGEISQAKKLLKSLEDEEGKLNLDDTDVKNAQKVLSKLIEKKQELNKPAIMGVDASAIENTNADLGNGIKLVQRFISQYNELEKQKAMKVDTSEAQKNLQNTAKALDNLPNEVKTSIGIDDADFKSKLDGVKKVDLNVSAELPQSSIDGINDRLTSIQPKDITLKDNSADVKGKLNTIEQFKINDKPFKVTITNSPMKTLRDINTYKIGNKTYTITKKEVTVKGGDWRGTAHARGTAYAHGSTGDWSVGYKGVSMGGELGEEILIRDGKFYTIGSDSAELFNHKPDDIIFNHKQTEQIFKYGKIHTGQKRGTAFAEGSAFAPGSATGSGGHRRDSRTTTTNAASQKSSSSKKSNSSSNKSSKNADTALDKFQDWFSRLFDWIEIKLERQTDKIDKYVRKAERAAERGNYAYSNSSYTSAIKETRTQIDNERTAKTKYNNTANKVISKAVSKGVISKKTANSIKKKVQNGTMNISEYSDKVQEVIKDYETWYNKSYEAQQAIEELQADLEEYSRKMIENISQKYQDKDETTETQLDLLEQRSKNAKSASAKNDYLKKAAKKYDTILSNDDKEIKEYNGIINSNKKIINKKNKDLRGSKYSKLKKSAKAKVDKVIDTAQNYVKQGKAIPSGTLDSIANYYAKGYIKGTFYDACIRYNDALDAKKQAETQKEIDAETAKAEKAALGAQMIENIEQEYQNKEDAIERTTRSKKTAQDLKKARRQDLSQQDYNDLINQSKLKQANYAAEATAIQKQIDDNIAQGLWTTTSQEYLDAVQKVADYQDEVQQCIIEQEELKVSLRDDVYWRTFERAHDAAKRLANVLKGINDLIDDNMLFNSDNELTEFGIAQLSLLTKEYESARKEVENYTNDINNLNTLYAQGEYTQQEYIEKLGELEDGILSSASSMKSSMNEILKLYQNIEKNELDALFEVIEARKKALSAKKEYYDYDKTLKTKNKDVQFLQAQLDALQGVEGLEARAKRAKLQAELAEKQEDLNDTIQEHQMNLSQEALDGLKDSLQEAFDDRWNDIYSDLHAIKELMTGAQNLTAASTQDIAKTLGELFGFYGINSSAQSAINGTITRQGFASGTKSVPRDMLAWTQENRKGEIIVRKSDGAILTPLSRGDSVIPNHLSERLYELAKVNPHTLIRDVNSSQLANAIPQVHEFNITQHYDTLLNVEGNVDSTVITDLEKFAKQFYRGSYEYTTKEIARDARKMGIK